MRKVSKTALLKRTLLFMLCLALVLSLGLTACSKTTSETTSEVTTTSKLTEAPTTTEAAPEPITFTLFNGMTSVNYQSQPDETAVGKLLQELTGVTLKVEYSIGQDVSTKIGLMISSGELPDLIIPGNGFQDLSSAGVLVPWNDMLDQYGANIKKVWGKYLDFFAQADGKIYSYSAMALGNNVSKFGQTGFYIKYGALREAGFPQVTTWNQYIDIVRNYVKNHPTIDGMKTIGFSGPGESWRFDWLIEGGDLLAGLPQSFYTFDPNDNWKCSPRTIATYRKSYLNKLNDLWIEGIMDKEVISQTFDQYIAKVTSGAVVALYDAVWEIQPAFNELAKSGNKDLYMVPVRLLDEGVSRDYYNGMDSMGNEPSLCITTKCKDPERALQFIDRMHQEDIIKLFNWGIEGDDYTIINKKNAFTEEQLKNYTDIEKRCTTRFNTQLYWNFPKFPARYDEYSDGSGPMSPEFTEQLKEQAYTQMEKEILADLGRTLITDIYDPMFVSPYGYGWDIPVPEDRTDLNEIRGFIFTDLSYSTYYQKMIMAKPGEFEKLWTGFETEFKKVDTSPLWDFYTTVARKRVEIVK